MEYLDERRPHFGAAVVLLVHGLNVDEHCILKLFCFLDATNLRIYWIPLSYPLTILSVIPAVISLLFDQSTTLFRSD